MKNNILYTSRITRFILLILYYFYIISNWKEITDNETISSPNYHPYQRHSPKSLQDNTTPLFVFGKEEKVKRFSLYDKWTNNENLKNSSSIEEENGFKNDSNKKEIKEEDKLSWEEIKKVSSVNSTNDIKQGSVEEKEAGERYTGSFADVNTNLQGKTILSSSYA